MVSLPELAACGALGDYIFDLGVHPKPEQHLSCPGVAFYPDDPGVSTVASPASVPQGRSISRSGREDHPVRLFLLCSSSMGDKRLKPSATSNSFPGLWLTRKPFNYLTTTWLELAEVVKLLKN